MIPQEDSLRLSQFTFRTDGNSSLNSYNFTQSDGKYIHIETMNDREVDTVKRNLTVKRRAFLKNNKKNSIDLNFLDKNGLPAFFIGVMHSEPKKILYIINEKDISHKKITLKKAYILDVSFIEM